LGSIKERLGLPLIPHTDHEKKRDIGEIDIMLRKRLEPFSPGMVDLGVFRNIPLQPHLDGPLDNQGNEDQQDDDVRAIGPGPIRIEVRQVVTGPVLHQGKTDRNRDER
jgi:hypothetical protein